MCCSSTLFFFKQKTAYEVRISDWSSDVCSSDLLGRLLRTAFLADYFVKDAFRNELRRVLNRGEAVNALKRAIYTGRVSPAQAKRAEEMQAVADALSLLANIIMAWNTTQMQEIGRPSCRERGCQYV